MHSDEEDVYGDQDDQMGSPTSDNMDLDANLRRWDEQASDMDLGDYDGQGSVSNGGLSPLYEEDKEQQPPVLRAAGHQEHVAVRSRHKLRKGYLGL